jgi:hypothetical protein
MDVTKKKDPSKKRKTSHGRQARQAENLRRHLGRNGGLLTLAAGWDPDHG